MPAEGGIPGWWPTTRWKAIPEFEVLVCCARRRLDEPSKVRLLTLLEAGLDWEILLSTAERHGMMPLVFHHLGSVGAEVLPDRILSLLSDRFRTNSERNLALAAELLKILKLLEDRGIPAVPFKGPVMAEHLYGDLAFREFYDLDVLVRRSDVLRARDLLTDRGYHVEPSLRPSEEGGYLKTQNTFVLVRDDSFCVELHWRFFPEHFSLALDAGAFLERRVPAPFAGRRVHRFALEDELLLLCAHGARHQWERLEWLAALAERIRSSDEIRWNELRSRASGVGGGRILELGLLLAGDLLGASVPADVRRRASEDHTTRSLASTVLESLSGGGHQPRTTWQKARFMLKARERWRDRVRYGLKLALTPTLADWRTVRLPARAFPLYLLIRAGRLVKKYAGL
ncbi:hypothetical protein BH18GEM1_BH18GEM1_06980 [soil metagenome]